MGIVLEEGAFVLESKLKKWASIKRNDTAIIETNTGNLISFEDLQYAVSATRNSLGNKPRKIIAAIPSGIEGAILWIASLTSGHTIIPVSPDITEFEYKELIKLHTPDITVADWKDRRKMYKKLLKLSDLKYIIKKGIQEKQSNTQNPKEGSVYLSSSGSTGVPKGMLLSATKVVITADNIRKSHRLSNKDRGLTPLPFYHVNAPVVSMVTSLLAGSQLIIAPKFSARNFWGWVEKYDPTWISIVPTIVAILLQTERPDFLDHASLRFIRTASAPLPVAYLEKFEKKFKIPLIETYGISEAASTICANPVPPLKHKAGSVGKPIGVTLSIRTYDKKSDTLRVVQRGDVGEICIKGSNVITTYENGVKNGSFVNGWFRTGDLGYEDKQGYIFITGRIKDIIIRGGENIAPREIEEVLLTHPAIQEIAVVGRPDPIYGEEVTAFAVLKNHHKGTKTAKEISSFATKKLSRQKVPSHIFVLKELPKGKTGKIDKKNLKEFSATD